MATPLRVCLFSESGSDSDAAQRLLGPATNQESFRAPFEQLTELRIVAECATWQELQESLHASPTDAVIVDLDGGEDSGRHLIIRQITEVAPTCGIIGVSKNANPDAIIAAMRAGCAQFVHWPIDLKDLQSAINRIRQMRAPAASGCRRICVVGSSGGAGATTVACNLAIELARATDRRCGLVDMNFQFGDVACLFDATPQHSVADICAAGAEIDRTLLETAIDDLPCNVSILASRQKVQFSDSVTADGIEQMFQVMSHMFPFVVVDLPRYFAPETIAALSGADCVLIVTQLAVPFLRNATRVYESLLEMGADEDRVEVVLNRCNANFERIKPEEVERHFGRPAFAVIPNDYKRIGASRDLGHPIVTDAPNSPARLAIQVLARRLAADSLGEKDPRPGGGLFGLFRRRRPKPAAT